MPLSSASVGACGEPVFADIDARWTMAYAAALGDATPLYLDTNARPDVLAHPLFPVCVEWPVFLGVHAFAENAALTAAERLRGVHATHDLVLHQPLRAEQRVSTRARVVCVEQRRAGAYQIVRLDTFDVSDQPLCTTWYGSMYRGVEVDGLDRKEDDQLPPAPDIGDAAHEIDSIEIEVPAGAAHTYSECARIWNPIHTDAAVASRAGLPGIILHGTATLALAVSAVVEHAFGGEAERVGRIAGSFRGMVEVPSKLRVRLFGDLGGAVGFEVRTAADGLAIRDGLVSIRSAS